LWFTEVANWDFRGEPFYFLGKHETKMTPNYIYMLWVIMAAL